MNNRALEHVGEQRAVGLTQVPQSQPQVGEIPAVGGGGRCLVQTRAADDAHVLDLWPVGGVRAVEAGHVEEAQEDARECALVFTSGGLCVDVLDVSAERWAPARLRAGDATFIPAGTPWRVLNRSSDTATYLAGRAVLLPEDRTPPT